jgi:hypothetical protein
MSASDPDTAWMWILGENLFGRMNAFPRAYADTQTSMRVCYAIDGDYVVVRLNRREDREDGEWDEQFVLDGTAISEVPSLEDRDWYEVWLRLRRRLYRERLTDQTFDKSSRFCRLLFGLSSGDQHPVPHSAQLERKAAKIRRAEMRAERDSLVAAYAASVKALIALDTLLRPPIADTTAAKQRVCRLIGETMVRVEFRLRKIHQWDTTNKSEWDALAEAETNGRGFRADAPPRAKRYRHLEPDVAVPREPATDWKLPVLPW